MAVAIPSDLILDVMRNATPAKAARAQELAAAEAIPATGPESFPVMVERMIQSAGPTIVSNPGAGRLDAAGASPQAAFEQMVLRNMFESMLPAADSGIFGDEGASSGVWRSLFADGLAGTYAKAGGLGIAASLPSTDGPVSGNQWPYFEQRALDGVSG